jgi:hypothetical protein
MAQEVNMIDLEGGEGAQQGAMGGEGAQQGAMGGEGAE